MRDVPPHWHVEAACPGTAYSTHPSHTVSPITTSRRCTEELKAKRLVFILVHLLHIVWKLRLNHFLLALRRLGGREREKREEEKMEMKELISHTEEDKNYYYFEDPSNISISCV